MTNPAEFQKMRARNFQMRAFWSMIVLLCVNVLTAPAATAATSQSMVIATLTAQFIAHNAEQDSLRTRDQRQADDDRRRIEEAAARKLADANRQFSAALKMQAQKDGVVIVAARAELVRAADAYTAKISENDAIQSAQIAAYRDQITQTVNSASPEKLAAFVRFVNGDDSAFAYIDEITRSEIAARHAAVRAQDIAQFEQLASLQETRYYLGRATKTEVVASWEEAVAVDPGDYQAPTGLCRFFDFAATMIGPGADPGSPLDTEQAAFAEAAATRCASLAAAVREPIRRLPLLKQVADIRSSRGQFAQALAAYKEGTDIIDSLVASGTMSKGLKDSVLEFAMIGAEAQRSLLRETNRAARTYPRLAQRARRAQRDQDFQKDKLESSHYYDIALTELSAMLQANHSVPGALADLPPIYSRMAHLMSLLGSPGAGPVYQSAIGVGESAFQADPSDEKARSQLSRAYTSAADFYSKRQEFDRSMALLDKAVGLWRKRLQAVPSDPDAIASLSYILQKKADRIDHRDAAGALALYQEVIDLCQRRMAMPSAEQDASDDIADAYEGAAQASTRLNNHLAAKTYALAAVVARHKALMGSKTGVDQKEALAQTLLIASDILTSSDEIPRAAAMLRERIAILQEFQAKYPDSEDYPEEIQDAQTRLNSLGAAGSPSH